MRCSESFVEKINLVTGSVLEFSAVVVAIVVYLMRNIDIYGLANVVYVPVLLFLIAVFSLEKGLISRFLQNAINQVLGSISMYLYMIHYVVINNGGSDILIKLLGTSDLALAFDSIILILISFALAYGMRWLEWRRKNENVCLVTHNRKKLKEDGNMKAQKHLKKQYVKKN